MLELSYEKMDSYIRQICSSEKLTYIKNSKEEEIPLLLRHATPRDKVLAELEYKKHLEEAKEMGLPSLQEMEKLIRDRGIFTEEDEAKIKKLKNRIKGQEAVLAKTTRVPARRDRIKNAIADLVSKVDEIQLKKEVNLEFTQERKAQEAKFLYLTRRCTFKPDTGEMFWPSQEVFESEADFLFRKRVFVEYVVFSHGIKQEYIRYIARSNLWRIRYITATKTGDSLFGCPISEYSVDQLTLLYWSHFYQSIYEMLPDERPSDNIIEDDQALDAYMKDWHADRNRDANAAKAKKNKKYGQNSAWDHDETLVMRSNPMHEDVQYSETLPERAGQALKGSSLDAAPFGRNKKESPLSKKRKS